MKILELTPLELDEFPRVLEEGILYISEECELAAHKCCCGCGEDVITPLNPARWRLIRSSGRVSLYPSIGNWKYACQSHYWIRQNRVIPSYGLADDEIAEVVELDQVDRERYFGQMQELEKPANPQKSDPRPEHWLARLFRRKRR